MITQKTFHTLLLFIVLFAMACTAKKEHNDGQAEHTAASPDSWVEMDEFHMVMAESFHPFKDSADLEPAKANAAAMAEAAEKWRSAPLPKKVDNEEIKEKLQQLDLAAAAFVQTAMTAEDKEIGESLTKLHDLFHELQEAWYGGHGEDGH
jgi:hypothetical protein